MFAVNERRYLENNNGDGASIKNNAAALVGKELEKLSASVLPDPIRQDTYEVINFDFSNTSFFCDLKETLSAANAWQTDNDLEIPRFFAEEGRFFFEIKRASSEERAEILKSQEALNYLFVEKLIPQFSDLFGRTVPTRDFFCESSLFKNAEEKKEVFYSLFAKGMEPSFLWNYNTFLQAAKRDNWFVGYENRPLDLAYFSLLAFFENKINEEELFVVHTVAAAYDEKSKGAVDLAGVKPCVLTSETLSPYLLGAGFPPFSRSRFITNCKSEEELQTNREEIVQAFSKRTPIERTSLEYTLNNFLISPFSPPMGEALAYYGLRHREGYKDVLWANKGTVVLLPPHFTVDLYRKTSQFEVKEPELMFGYHPNPPCFYEGKRVGSFASPLYRLDLPHGFEAGVQGLSMQHHDTNHHMIAEANMPGSHIEKSIEISKFFLDFIGKISEASNLERLFLDRDAGVFYRDFPPSRAFSKYVKQGIIEKIPRASFASALVARLWVSTMVAPLFSQALGVELGDLEGLDRKEVIEKIEKLEIVAPPI